MIQKNRQMSLKYDWIPSIWYPRNVLRKTNSHFLKDKNVGC